jgi:hypothetical protein
MVSPRPWHDGQVRSMVKKPWLARTLPIPPQVRQVDGEVPALAPEPEQLSQVTGCRHLDLRVLAFVRLGERDLHSCSEGRRRARAPRRCRGRRWPMNSPNRSSNIADIDCRKSAPNRGPRRRQGWVEGSVPKRS